MSTHSPIPAHPGDTGSAAYRFEPADRELFDREIRAWMPPGSFDVHAHLYDLRMLVPNSDGEFQGPAEVGYSTYLAHQQRWMGDRVPTESLFFPFPVRGLDAGAANDFLASELRAHPELQGLMMLRPQDDPAEVEAAVQKHGWRGFKVYHVFADRPDTFHAETGEFIPEWAWELADRYGLTILLHLVLDRALADVRNQAYVCEHCLRYPSARLILAHAARGFCGYHTVEGVSALATLSNVWFDTSAICEPMAFEAILRTFGSTRLMYGSDFPVSEMRGHAMSLGDGFWWLYGHERDWSGWTLGSPTKVGLQSLLALKQATRTLCLREPEIENIFSNNARRLFPRRALSNAEQPVAEVVRLRTERDVDAGRSEFSRIQLPEVPQAIALYREARQIIPGGTQLLSKRPEMFAPEQWPAYFAEAHGCEVIDIDGRRYLDFTHNGVGACLLGYAHPRVTAAVVRRVQLGAMASLNSPDEVQLARELIALHPWSQQVRLARGGGEVLSIAARIARAATGRDVIAFCGYHGWSDWYLAANLGTDRALDGHLLPGLSPGGVPRGLQGTALPFAFNKLDELQAIVRQAGPRLAAVIMEPTRNTPPTDGFLSGVRQLCDDCGAKLIFDEVTTGFRLRSGGAHLNYGIEPDGAVFAKALGSGHPIAALIGKASLMDAAQNTFISSTYWTDGVGPAAALATLAVLREVDVPAHVRAIGMQFRSEVQRLALLHELPLNVSGYPALTGLSFAHPSSAALLTLFSVRMLKHGFLAAGGFYPTLGHQPHHVAAFAQAADSVFAELAEAICRGDIEARIGGPVKHTGFARLT